MPPFDYNEPDSVETTSGMSPVLQLSVFLHNQVGALLGLVKTLEDNHLEVLGLSLQDSADLTLVRMVVSDPESALILLLSHGISCASKPVVVVELNEGVEDLSRTLAALLSAEINIHHTYPLLVRPSDRPLLALYLDDCQTGMESLSRCGFKVLSQSDLSR